MKTAAKKSPLFALPPQKKSVLGASANSGTSDDYSASNDYHYSASGYRRSRSHCLAPHFVAFDAATFVVAAFIVVRTF